MAAEITLKAGDTEPLTITLAATGLSSLDGLSSATLYARKQGATTNHVDGGTLAVLSSAGLTLTFDPVDQKRGGGNAFDAAGTYLCYVRAAWTDGDVTRHPGEGHLTVTVEDDFE